MDRAVVGVAGELDLLAAPRVAATVDDLLDVGIAGIVMTCANREIRRRPYRTESAIPGHAGHTAAPATPAT